MILAKSGFLINKLIRSVSTNPCRIIGNSPQHARVNYLGFSHSIFFSVPMILVSTGSPLVSATKTEVINIENNGLTCKNLEEYPLQVSGAVGSNMGSSPVICGGSISWSSLNQCHRLESGKWQNFANLTQAYVYTIFGLL